MYNDADVEIKLLIYLLYMWTSNKFCSVRWMYSCLNLLELVRGRHDEASIVVLRQMSLLRHAGYTDLQYIYIDALYLGREPTTDDPEGGQRNLYG